MGQGGMCDTRFDTDAQMGLSETWRQAARQRTRHDDLTDRNPLDAAADAAVAVVLVDLLGRVEAMATVTDRTAVEDMKARIRYLLTMAGEHDA